MTIKQFDKIIEGVRNGCVVIAEKYGVFRILSSIIFILACFAIHKNVENKFYAIMFCIIIYIAINAIVFIVLHGNKIHIKNNDEIS